MRTGEDSLKTEKSSMINDKLNLNLQSYNMLYATQHLPNKSLMYNSF